MAIKIFDVQPDSKPRTNDDIVGRFRSGQQLNNRPVALSEWRITTADADVADAIAAAFGGQPETWAATGDDSIEVLTSATTVDIVLDGPDSVRTSMVIWGRSGKVHECDGENITLEGPDHGQPCPYASLSLQDHKDLAKAGRACEPSVQVYFRLADNPGLGKFKFFSGSWSLASEVGDAERKLAKIGGPALATLTLEKVEYTTKAGKDVSFTKPVLKVTGPAPAVEPF